MALWLAVPSAILRSSLRKGDFAPDGITTLRRLKDKGVASMSEGFDEILTDSSPRVQDLATRTQVLIRDVMPDFVEVPWPRQRVVGYGVGPRKTSEHFCYITFHTSPSTKTTSTSVSTTAPSSPDPEGSLQGSGKLLRHVKITTLEDLSNPLCDACSRPLPRPICQRNRPRRNPRRKKRPRTNKPRCAVGPIL